MASKGNFPLEEHFYQAHRNAMDTVLELQNAYELCMKNTFGSIIPVIQQVFSDPQSGRGGPELQLRIHKDFSSWFDFARSPEFSVQLIEVDENGDYGCFKLHVQIDPPSGLNIILERIDRLDPYENQRCFFHWEAKWFAQEVANRTNRIVRFQRGGGSWPGISSDLKTWGFTVKPVRKKEKR